LYAGDCKMAALETRADLADAGDYYTLAAGKPTKMNPWEQLVT